MTPESLEILFRDEALLAVNKPSGLMIHRGGHTVSPNEPVLEEWVQAHVGGTAFSVHRLDRATSGVILFALNKEANRALQALFSERLIQKCYLALAAGILEEDLVVDTPLTRRARGNQKRQPLLPAKSAFRILDVQSGCSWVEVKPTTGRQHQIRRHLKGIGHPIVMDRMYGYKRFNRDLRMQYFLHRLALHAFSLQFPHPLTKEPLRIEAPLPEDLLLPLQKMGFSTLIPE